MCIQPANPATNRIMQRNDVNVVIVCVLLMTVSELPTQEKPLFTHARTRTHAATSEITSKLPCFCSLRKLWKV